MSLLRSWVGTDTTFAAEAGWPLVCPRCHGHVGSGADEQAWSCESCAASWPLCRGLPSLYEEEQVTGTDRFMRLFYDGLPSLHDPLTRHLLPRLQHGASEEQLRRGFLDRMGLWCFGWELQGRVPQVLEVGLGTGVNIQMLFDRLRGHFEVDYWGVDLSRGMLRECQRRQLPDRARVRLAMADVHALPFASDSMDLVFHVGAMGSFRDPAAALAEMVRVARPGARIVVVDEQLDPSLERTLATRLKFWLVTFYDDDPGAPVHHLPPGMEQVQVSQITPFYYCLSFIKPAGSSPTRSTTAP